MKVIAFNGSPNHDGVIHGALEMMCAELGDAGIETEIVQAGRENIRGCIACGKCGELGKCVFDDIVNQASAKINSADGIIIGSPVYYGSIAGNFKCFLDRLFYSGVNLEFKPVSAVVSCRRSGGINAFHQLNNYFNLAKAIITPSLYWGVIHGNTVEELRQDKEGMHVVKTSARDMAWLVKVLALGKKEIPVPAARERPWTNFVH